MTMEKKARTNMPARKHPARRAARKAAVPLEIREQIVCAAGPENVFGALSRAVEWRDWLCAEARMDSGPKPAWQAKWANGYRAWGTVTGSTTPRRLTLSWRDAEGQESSRVTFTLKPDGTGTRLSLVHDRFGKGESAVRRLREARRAWAGSLETLKSIVETGIDLRIARRPVVGVNVDTVDSAAASGVAAGALKITAVVPGLPAQAAGLAAGDVILTLDGRKIVGYPMFIGVLQRHTAGDRVAATVLRDGAKLSVTLDLVGRPMPEYPADPVQMAARSREVYRGVFEELERVLAGVGEEEASRLEAPGKWCVKEVLAHLSVCERDNQLFTTLDILGEPVDVAGNPTIAAERLRAAIAVTPAVADLAARYRADVEETHRIFAGLRPEARDHKAKYRRISQGLLDYAEHAKGHLRQMRRILEAVRKQS